MVRKHCRFPANCPIQQPNYLVQTFYHKTTRYLVKSAGEAPICSWKIPSSLAEALTQKMFQQDLFNTKSWFPNWIIKELMTLNYFFCQATGPLIQLKNKVRVSRCSARDVRRFFCRQGIFFFFCLAMWGIFPKQLHVVFKYDVLVLKY